MELKYKNGEMESTTGIWSKNQCHRTAFSQTTCTISLDGAAMFLPISEWDVDDYNFHAPVKSVEEFSDWLGQDGWRVRATVMRFGDEDADLDIMITRRMWSGDAPPQPRRVGKGATVWLFRMRIHPRAFAHHFGEITVTAKTTGNTS